MELPLGSPLPPGDEHAVSVYLPTWKDSMGWVTRNPDLLKHMKTGYPRFFIPLIVRKLSDQLVEWAASKQGSEAPDQRSNAFLTTCGQAALLFPSMEPARACEIYFQKETKDTFIVHVTFTGVVHIFGDSQITHHPCSHDELYAVVYPQHLAVTAKSFWQHTGFGISSRCASFWLENAPFLQKSKIPSHGFIKLPTKKAKNASMVIQQRIANLQSSPVNEVGSDSVYLHPTGMSAISHTATALCSIRKKYCSVAVFGFLYVDTFKVLDKIYEFKVKLYGHANAADLEVLEKDLAGGLKIDALYTEFPGNPLLGSVDLERLYQLGHNYEFLLIVDDTVATSVNTKILPYCDIVCTSLTKMFSGGCNVMGGAITLNPKSKHFTSLQQTFTSQYNDTYFPQDVLVMESNSTDFSTRVLTASHNASIITSILRQHPSVSQVFYPEGHPTQAIYDQYKRPGKGYGFLLSITFVKPEAAIAFHDALDVAKGPSLGTNFTLCCAYTLYAHFGELEWAKKFGVIEHLVRISVGVEGEELLRGIVQTALDKAAETL